MNINPLDWSLWLSIPLAVVFYFMVALADAAVWRWWMESVPQSLWDPANRRYIHNTKEKKKYEAREFGMYWAFGWPGKYVVLFFYQIVQTVVETINSMLDSVAESGRRTRNARLLAERQERYEKLYAEICTWEIRDIDRLDHAKSNTWLEFKALEEFVPARALPQKLESNANHIDRTAVRTVRF
jgi:hypothetical protein